MRRILFFLLAITVSATALTVSAEAQKRYVAHLRGNQEVPANNSTATGRCTIVLNATETQITVNCTYAGLGTAANAGHIHDNGPVGVNGPVRFNFGTVTGTSGTLSNLTFTVTAAQVADLNAKRWYVNIHTSGFPGGEIRGQVKPTNTIYDRDGDGRTDVVVYRFGASAFYTLRSLDNAFQSTPFGATGTNADIFLNSTADDFDGDGLGDPLILNLSGTRLHWRIFQTNNSTVQFYDWGDFAAANQERLAIADYDGDGRTDVAVYRRATGIWYILESSTGQPRQEYWGSPAGTDDPSIGDYDGDGRADLTVVRTVGADRVWYTRLSRTGQQVSVAWGNSTDAYFFFAPIDVDGDGKQDRMVRRTVGGQTNYFVLQSSNLQLFSLQWGVSTDTGLFGDYDGDGKTDFVARRLSGTNLLWSIYQSATPATPRYVNWGVSGDQ